MPRFVIASFFHRDWKDSSQWVTSFGGRVMFRACDFVWLILRLDKIPKALIFLRRLGREIRGDVKERIMSSANAVTLNSLSFTFTPCMSGWFLSLLRKGSRVRMYIRGERGHP